MHRHALVPVSSTELGRKEQSFAHDCVFVVAPGRDTSPASHSVFSHLPRLLVLVYLPPGQGRQLVGDALPVLAEYFPAWHSSHLFLPVAAWYVPVAHVMHSILPPAGWDLPAAHAMHAAPLALEAAAAVRALPAAHTVQDVWPALAWYSPMAHATHVSWPTAG
jgi:hypothetical protein